MVVADVDTAPELPEEVDETVVDAGGTALIVTPYEKTSKESGVV